MSITAPKAKARPFAVDILAATQWIAPEEEYHERYERDRVLDA
jgi:hypothetical protein